MIMMDNKDLNKALKWRKQPYQLTLQQWLIYVGSIIAIITILAQEVNKGVFS